jgi:hypothetical protein
MRKFFILVAITASQTIFAQNKNIDGFTKQDATKQLELEQKFDNQLGRNFQWEKDYGGTSFDQLNCIKQISDHGYIM